MGGIRHRTNAISFLPGSGDGFFNLYHLSASCWGDIAVLLLPIGAVMLHPGDHAFFVPSQGISMAALLHLVAWALLGAFAAICLRPVRVYTNDVARLASS